MNHVCIISALIYLNVLIYGIFFFFLPSILKSKFVFTLFLLICSCFILNMMIFCMFSGHQMRLESEYANISCIIYNWSCCACQRVQLDIFTKCQTAVAAYSFFKNKMHFCSWSWRDYNTNSKCCLCCLAASSACRLAETHG